MIARAKLPPLLLAAALLFPSWAVDADPRPLSDGELDRLTAGRPAATPAGGSGTGETVVANASRADLAFTSRVRLDGPVQQGRTLNLVNAARADAANAANVWNGAARGTVTGGGASVGQENRISQSERSQGQLGRSQLLGRNITESFSESFSSSSSRFFSESRRIVSTRSLTRTVIEETAASVPKFNPLQNFSVSLGNFQFGNVPLGTLSVGGFVVDPVFGTRTGLEASVGPVTILGPRMDLGSLRFSGDDLIVTPGSATLPGVSFGNASVEGCIADICDSGTFHIGTLGGQTLSSPIPEFTIAGANPFKDFDLNLGHGIAAAGEGSVRSSGVDVTLGAGLSINFPSLSGFSNVVADIPGIGGVAGEVLDVVIPDFEFPPIAVSAQVPIPLIAGFEASFDGVICLTVQNVDCGTSSRTVSVEEQSVQSESLTEASGASSSESRSASASRRVVIGARLAHAQADEIVMSDSALSRASESTVTLANGAQQNMRAVNAVNASRALAGNALNVSRSSASARALRLHQSNVFVQQR